MVGLDVSWMPPESSCTVNSYDIQYRQGTDDGWSTESTMSTLYLLSGLPYGSTYQIQVRAVSDDREGPWSNEVQEATYNGMISNQLYINTFFELYNTLNNNIFIMHNSKIKYYVQHSI